MARRKLAKLVWWLAAAVVALVAGSVTCEAALNGATVATVAGAAVHQVATEVMELIGEEGAELYCEQRGYKPLLKHTEKQYLHGWDQVWFDAKRREVVCIEAKGGAGRLRPGQETIDHAIQSAKRMLRSPKATARERKAAQLVLEYAERGRLRVEVIHTPKAGARPKLVRVKQASRYDRQLAREILDTLQREGKLPLPRGTYGRPYAQLRREVTGGAKHAPQTGKGARRLPRRLGKVAATEDALGSTQGLRRATKVARKAGKGLGIVVVATEVAAYGIDAYQIEKQYQRGAISHSQRVEAHVKLGARTAGGAAGGAAGAWVGAYTGAAIGSAAGPVGTVVGGVVGGIAGAVGGSELGSRLGEAAVDFSKKVRRWWNSPGPSRQRSPKRQGWFKRTWNRLMGG